MPPPSPTKAPRKAPASAEQCVAPGHVEAETSLDVRLAEAQARAARAERDLTAANALIDAQTSLLAGMRSSSSWRLTRPVRVLARLLRGDQTLTQLTGYFSPGLRSLLARVPAVGRRRSADWSGPKRSRPPAHKASFPLPGALVTLPELLGALPSPLDIGVSVIIPTLNAGAEFYWLLRKLTAQMGLARIEIVVVDSGSTDGTIERAEAFGCTLVHIPSGDFSHSAARNLGADTAGGDVYLFTVQDAYPVGDYWLHSMALALLWPKDPSETLAAVSCTEFPRADSDLIYNAAVDTHSRFLGCHDGDRIGALAGSDQESLRAQGQLSDLACMISAQTFHQYRYEGRYAEDLILGVRLVQDGLKVAMLSSVKVIHSHNRSAAYHLKRTFVDVTFLNEGFPDHVVHAAGGVRGVIQAGSDLLALIEDWQPALGENGGSALRALIAQCSKLPDFTPVDIAFGAPGLAEWLRATAALEPENGEADAEDLRVAFIHRLEQLADFVTRTYGPIDDFLRDEMSQAARKTLSSTIGGRLAAYYLHQTPTAHTQRLRILMLDGV